MKEDTISKHVKESLQKVADTLQKQCDSLKQQIKEVKQKICERAGKIVDAAKRKGKRALYKITQITGMRKKLAAVKDKVDRQSTEWRVWRKQWRNAVGSRERADRRKLRCRVLR